MGCVPFLLTPQLFGMTYPFVFDLLLLFPVFAPPWKNTILQLLFYRIFLVIARVFYFSAFDHGFIYEKVRYIKWNTLLLLLLLVPYSVLINIFRIKDINPLAWLNYTETLWVMLGKMSRILLKSDRRSRNERVFKFPNFFMDYKNDSKTKYEPTESK